LKRWFIFEIRIYVCALWHFQFKIKDEKLKRNNLVFVRNVNDKHFYMSINLKYLPKQVYETHTHTYVRFIKINDCKVEETYT